MAFTSSATWECQQSASDSNGGGFDPGVAGFPTDLTTDANTGNTSAPVCSSASYNFVAGDVGAWLYIKSGTSWIPGWYKITSVASNKATVNATIGAAVLAAGTPSTVTGIATVGTPTAGTGNVDYSQQSAAQIAFSDLVIGATTTQFTSAAHPVGKNFVGNVINITGGTGFTVQRVVVVSVSGTTATCDKSLGTAASTGGTGNLGGAMASPALPFSVAVNLNLVFIKSGSYTLSSSSTNVANGLINATQQALRIEGYGSVRGDLGTAPVLTASGISTVSLVATASGTQNQIKNLTVDGASLTSIRCFNLGSGYGYLLFAKNATNTGIATTTTTLEQCRATGCATAGAGINGTGIWCGCVSYSNTVSGFNTGSNMALVDCIAYSNSGASSDGFASGGTGATFINCAAYSNGRQGFNLSQTSCVAINCIAESNGSIGLTVTANSGLLINCAAFSNSTNFNIQSNVNGQNINPITYTASAFVNAAGGNFALNANAGGGAALRAAGIPGVTPDGLSTGYLDIGAIQSPPLWPPARAFTWSN